MDFDIIITGGVGLVTSTVSALVSWFLARKKYNAETDANIIENMQKSLEFYKALVEDNKNRLEEVLKRNETLEDEVMELRKQVTSLMLQMCLNTNCQNRKLSKTKKE